MIDLSDGLSTDLEHICQESQRGRGDRGGGDSARAGSDWEKNGSALEFALHGGDDYELLFTSAAADSMRRWREFELTRIWPDHAIRICGMRLIGADGKRGSARGRRMGTLQGEFVICDLQFVITQFRIAVVCLMPGHPECSATFEALSGRA
jgi:hypothetical protein